MFTLAKWQYAANFTGTTKLSESAVVAIQVTEYFMEFPIFFFLFVIFVSLSTLNPSSIQLEPVTS